MTTFPVLVHEYPGTKPGKVAHAHELVHPGPAATASPSPSPPVRRNALVFIGGLGDGPHTVPYIRAVAAKLESAALGYSVFEILMASSYAGYGFGSLARDVADVSALVGYLRSLGKERVVLMGHSTGCQDCMEYANYEKHRNSPVDGFILQGPVSDREGLASLMDGDTLKQAVGLAEQMINSGKQDECMPRVSGNLPDFFTTPLTAYRFHSLAAVGGDDDYFSSDLADETVAAIWSRVPKPILIVPSEKDEFALKSVDFARLVDRWMGHCKPGIASELSGLIPGANHRVDPPESQDWLADRVVKFVGSLSSDL